MVSMAALAFQMTTARERERERDNQTAMIADRWTSKIAHNRSCTQQVHPDKRRRSNSPGCCRRADFTNETADPAAKKYAQRRTALTSRKLLLAPQPATKSSSHPHQEDRN
jgi:hypothetical protein